MVCLRRIFHVFKGTFRCIHRKSFSRSYCEQVNGESNTLKPAVDGDSKWPRRVITGLQPTGELHIGNYFGVLKRCVQLQDQGEDLMVFIADLHALTTPQNPKVLSSRVLDVAAALIGSGVDPERCCVFAQSAVPRHAELCWTLACLATQARLSRLPHYQEKAAVTKEVPVGLLLYPVMQAADVLVYRGTHVPVGADQIQHLQIASQLVKTFSYRYGRAFPTPKPLISEDGSDRIRSLRDPSKKMSKSDTDPKSRILISDPDDVIALKIRKAVTDFTPEITWDPVTRPGIANLILLQCLSQDKTPEEVVEEADGLNTVQYKQMVAAALSEALGPVREKTAQLRARPELLRELLRHGAAKARARADVVHEEVSAMLGLTSLDAHQPLHVALKQVNT